MSDLLPKKYKDIRLLNDGVLVKPFKYKEIGGILIPATVSEKNKGTVVAVGIGRLKENKKDRHSMQVKVGDAVYHTQYAGSEIKIESEDYLIMKEDDIYGIYNNRNSITDITPLNNRVFIQWEQGEKKFKGTSLVRSNIGMERHYTGIVLGVGKEVYDVTVGTRVFFDQFCGPERIDHDNKRYAFILDYDVYCEIPKRLEMEVQSQ